MNPRHRRLILPGLLIALLVVVLVSALAERAGSVEDAPAQKVSTLRDPRIGESSGLVVSSSLADLAYTVNDSGNSPQVYAVRISTGETLGTTTLTGYEFRDIEALSIDDGGRLWVADTGDNNAVRDEEALYVLDDPGTETATVEPDRYRVAYAEGSQDVESVAIDPEDGTVHLFTKGLLGGERYELGADASTDGLNVLEAQPGKFPLLLTDASFAPDGEVVLIRNYVSVFALDARTWEQEWTIDASEQKQGETIAFETSGESFLIGSEGVNSDLLRLALQGEPAPTVPTQTPGPGIIDTTTEPPSAGGPSLVWLAALVGAVGLPLLAFGTRRRPPPKR